MRRDVMIGSGTVVHALLEGNAEQYHEAMRDLLLPPITEESLWGHSLYTLLLEARSLRNVSVDVLDAWMGSAKAYVWESVEDRGVLVTCAFLEAMGKLPYMPHMPLKIMIVRRHRRKKTQP